MKQISIEQINAVLNAIYQTNITAQNFDLVKKLFSELKDVEKVEIPETTQADVIPSEVTDH